MSNCTIGIVACPFCQCHWNDAITILDISTNCLIIDKYYYSCCHGTISSCSHTPRNYFTADTTQNPGRPVHYYNYLSLCRPMFHFDWFFLTEFHVLLFATSFLLASELASSDAYWTIPGNNARHRPSINDNNFLHMPVDRF